jgi:glycosyltransferase involved in cell wall biosynthesis
MRISVIIPTYNRAALIGETLDSILAQTRPADEIIVVDDGSTDDTPAVIAARYPMVRLIRIANSGDMVGRNVGLRAATSDLVAFCDSDDLWRPDHLAAMARLWQLAPAVRFAYANFHLVVAGAWQEADKFAGAPAGFWDGLRPLDDNLAIFDPPMVDPPMVDPPMVDRQMVDRPMVDRPMPGRLLDFQPIFPSALVCERQFMIGTGGWDEGVSRVIGCDFATALRLVEHVPSGVVRRATVGIRKHGGNISADAQKMNLGDSFVLEHVLATRPSLAPYAEAIRAKIVVRRRDAFETAFARGDLPGARQIDGLLPGGLGGKLALKRAITRLPAPMDRWFCRLLTGVRGSA